MNDSRNRAVFFDFDETLIGTHRASKVAYQKVEEFLRKSSMLSCVNDESIDSIISKYKRFLGSVPNDRYKTQTPSEIRIELWNKAIRETCQQIDEADSLELAKDVYELWHTTRVGEITWLEPKTESILILLRRTTKLVLITNGSSVIQWEKIKQVNAERYFDHVIVSGDEPHDKPHKSIFEKACRLCGLEPHNCIMVGDTISTDILGANLALLSSSIFISNHESGNSVNTNHPPAADQVACTPTHTISSIAELPAILSSYYDS